MARMRHRAHLEACAFTRLSFITKPVADMLLRRYLETAALASFPAPPEAMYQPSRGKAETSFARQVAMYLAHVTLGLNFTRIGEIFGRDRTTASHACVVVEDARDDHVIDRTIEMLEAASRMTVKRSLVLHSALTDA
jgi:chromosomal replication initiation ATPase DnaA